MFNKVDLIRMTFSHFRIPKRNSLLKILKAALLVEILITLDRNLKPIYIITAKLSGGLLSLPDGNIAYCSLDRTVLIHNLKKNTVEKKLVGHGFIVLSLLLLSNNTIASGSDDQTIRIWDFTNDPKCIHILRGHKHAVSCLVTHSDGKLISGSWDKAIRVWDSTNNFRCINIISKAHSDAINSLLSLNNGRLASASDDFSICIWNISEPDDKERVSDIGKYECINILNGHLDRVTCIIQLKCGNIVSASEDKTIKIWDQSNNYACVKTMEGHRGGISSVILFADCYIISASHDGKLRIWNSFGEYKCLMVVKAHKGVISSMVKLPHNQLATASTHEIKIWEI
jgi:WD40 repeat protein